MSPFLDKIDVVKVPVRTVRVQLRCEKCCIGFMQLDVSAGIRASYPPQYRHKCSNCEHDGWIVGKSFPYIDYEEIAEVE